MTAESILEPSPS
uniref:GATA transcription factor 5-like n=1 Tax=Rhizophora mucronata TaxID=61149 RepID=A0A2P2MJ73_RHIMU